MEVLWFYLFPLGVGAVVVGEPRAREAVGGSVAGACVGMVLDPERMGPWLGCWRGLRPWILYMEVPGPLVASCMVP